MSHVFPIRVYYEDTDMGGIVYHANYLKYIERARSDWVRGVGVNQVLLKEEGVVFAVRKVDAEYLLTARMDDDLQVHTSTLSVSGARLVVDQKVMRGDDLVFAAEVTIVCINDTGQPTRLPANIRLMLH